LKYFAIILFSKGEPSVKPIIFIWLSILLFFIFFQIRMTFLLSKEYCGLCKNGFIKKAIVARSIKRK